MYDFNLLQQKADQLLKAQRYAEALAIYYYMADGDRSLDAGSLAQRIGAAYEGLGDRHAAKYWYGRAQEENPEIEFYRAARDRLNSVSIDAILRSA